MEIVKYSIRKKRNDGFSNVHRHRVPRGAVRRYIGAVTAVMAVMADALLKDTRLKI